MRRDASALRSAGLQACQIATAACLLLALGPFAGAEQGGGALQAQRAFKVGLTALHNFEYEDANEAKCSLLP